MSTRPNVPLLRKALAFVETEAAKPDALCEWVQDSWVMPATEAEREKWGATWLAVDNEKSAECGSCYCVAGFVVAATVGPVNITQVYRVAREQLGIDREQAADLFASDNTAADVRRVVEGIFAGVGERVS